MRQFNITVNGKSYAVEVEEVGAGLCNFTYAPAQNAHTQPPQASAPKPATAVPQTPAPAPKVLEEAVSGEKITAPMPGTVLDIRVSEGQTVKAGDMLLILEAMKMENEIVSPVDGVVKKIHILGSATVSTGDALVTIENN